MDRACVVDLKQRAHQPRRSLGEIEAGAGTVIGARLPHERAGRPRRRGLASRACEPSIAWRACTSNATRWGRKRVFALATCSRIQRRVTTGRPSTSAVFSTSGSVVTPGWAEAPRVSRPQSPAAPRERRETDLMRGA